MSILDLLRLKWRRSDLSVRNTAAAPTAMKLEGRDYFNQEWNFGLTVPNGWDMAFENEGGYPWMQPLRIVGPKASSGRPYLSVLVQPADEDGKGLRGYMDKAESDLRGGFAGFALDKKRETSLLGSPVAWMTYGYQTDSGPRMEINATVFFGHGRMMLFQFICETDSDRASEDFPLFENIIKSLRIGSAGIRHPRVTLSGATACGLCSKSLSGGKVHSMLNLKLGRLIPVCDSCRNAASEANAQKRER